MIHLDTSFLIRALTPASPEDRALRGWLVDREPVRMSVIGWAEFLCGPVDAAAVGLAERILDEPVPFIGADVTVTAQLYNQGGRRRGSLLDCMIAAVAIRAGATLATANPSDFRRYASTGLVLAGG